MALCARLAPAALTRRANNILRIRELGRLALVQLLQTDFVLLLHAASLARNITPAHTRHASHAAHASKSATAHAAKHLREDVVHVGPGAAHAVRRIEGGHAVRVVEVPLVVIVEDLVGLLGGFEADFCFGAVGFGDFVGVVGEGGLDNVRMVSWRWGRGADFVVRFFDLGFAGGFADAEHLWCC